MSAPQPSKTTDTQAAAESLRKAAKAKKCWSCGCLHSSLKAIRDEMGDTIISNGMASAITDAEKQLVAVQYDCLGCAECYPADAVNALGIEGDACPADPVERREGWPPLPGNYTALRYQAPVAVCTLTDENLYAQMRDRAASALAIVGALQTENLGIERLIDNILANPHIRFLVICGADSRQRIGHLPGQSLVALAGSGLDERGRIVGVQGKRPVIRNLDAGAVEHFRRSVEVVDRIGESDVSALSELCDALAKQSPGPAEPFAPRRAVRALRGHVPERMVSDPNGYFVIYVDRVRGTLSMEHYATSGVLDCIIEGPTAAEVYIPAIENNLVSRLDHAAYLGRELARAEGALKSSDSYVQDGAPERTPVEGPSECGCGGKCGGS